ncbi:AAA family ATPase [Pseudomonas sp. RP23018S]|nr:AAA family ATPase [Pseudomonas sp. RP23018S]MDZ5604562.1 AAA family ATPase [Pseudomonas sp. RP23018S]
MTLYDVMNVGLEPVRHSVKPWMPCRRVTLFGGHWGIGKSSLALAIAAHVVCGRSFAGMEVERSPVLFVSLEDKANILRFRLRRIIEAYRLPAAQVLAGLRVLDGTHRVAALMTEGDSFDAVPIFTPAFRELSGHAGGAGLIVIDNASDAFGANENSRRTVRTFVRGLAAVAREHNAAVVLLAHIGKAAAKGSSNGNSYSGSTDWYNSAGSRLALLEEDGGILPTHEKANLSARAEPVPITFLDGVPASEAGTQGDGVTAEDLDRSEIIRVMKAAHDAGISVPASTVSGAHSVMKASDSLTEFGVSPESSAPHAPLLRLFVSCTFGAWNSRRSSEKSANA